MPRATRVLFSLHGDHMFISNRDDEDQFLQYLLDNLDAEYAVETNEEQVMEEEQLEGEDPSAVEKDRIPAEEGPEGEPAEAEEGPDGEPAKAEEDSVAGPMMDDEGWIEDPFKDSDDESLIDWEAELLPIDDVPIDWDDVLQHLNDLPSEEQQMWQFDADEDLVRRQMRLWRRR